METLTGTQRDGSRVRRRKPALPRLLVPEQAGDGHAQKGAPAELRQLARLDVGVEDVLGGRCDDDEAITRLMEQCPREAAGLQNGPLGLLRLHGPSLRQATA